MQQRTQQGLNFQNELNLTTCNRFDDGIVASEHGGEYEHFDVTSTRFIEKASLQSKWPNSQLNLPNNEKMIQISNSDHILRALQTRYSKFFEKQW